MLGLKLIYDSKGAPGIELQQNWNFLWIWLIYKIGQCDVTS